MQSKKKRQLVEETILSSYESMYRIAFTYVKNQEDALDIVQDSACRAMQYADSGKSMLKPGCFGLSSIVRWIS